VSGVFRGARAMSDVSRIARRWAMSLSATVSVDVDLRRAFAVRGHASALSRRSILSSSELRVLHARRRSPAWTRCSYRYSARQARARSLRNVAGSESGLL
jgi:hypothetical protein